MTTIHFANLTNGIVCAPPDSRTCRIQSTWCEQKRWADVLWTLPSDFYLAVANGSLVVVHDQSERSRLTRAQWQGLSWIRYALRAAWGVPEERELARSGHNVTSQWRLVWSQLPDRVKALVTYYAPPCPVSLTVAACECARVAAHQFIAASQPHAASTAPVSRCGVPPSGASSDRNRVRLTGLRQSLK